MYRYNLLILCQCEVIRFKSIGIPLDAVKIKQIRKTHGKLTARLNRFPQTFVLLFYRIICLCFRFLASLISALRICSGFLIGRALDRQKDCLL